MSAIIKMMRSVYIVHLLGRWRKKIIAIVALMAGAFFAWHIHTDVAEYLQLVNKTEWIIVSLLVKWLIIISCIASSVLILISSRHNPTPPPDEPNTPSLSEREQQFLRKKKLRTKADMLLER